MSKQPTKDTKGVKIEFLEGMISKLQAKAAVNDVDPKIKMKYLAQICRRVLHHYTENFDEFTPVALLFEKDDKTFILSKEKVKKEIKIQGLESFMKLFPGLAPPKVIHLSEINKIDKMLEKEEQNDNKSKA